MAWYEWMIAVVFAWQFGTNWTDEFEDLNDEPPELLPVARAIRRKRKSDTNDS